MKYVLIIYEVEDYAHWKAGFDRAAALRKAAGEIEYQLLRSDQDARRIVHYSRWDSHEAARTFFESDEVAAIRDELGVQSPEFVYLEELENAKP